MDTFISDEAQRARAVARMILWAHVHSVRRELGLDSEPVTVVRTLRRKRK